MRVRIDGSRAHPLWSLNDKGSFSINSFYNHLTRRETSGRGFPYRQIWKVNASPKVAFFPWEAARGCISTLDKLIIRDKVLVNGSYMCRRAVDHVTIYFCGAPLHIDYGPSITTCWILIE